MAHLDLAQRPFGPAVCHRAGTPCDTVLAGLATRECHTQPGERAWLSQQCLHPEGAMGSFRVREMPFGRQGWRSSGDQCPFVGTPCLHSQSPSVPLCGGQHCRSPGKQDPPRSCNYSHTSAAQGCRRGGDEIAGSGCTGGAHTTHKHLAVQPQRHTQNSAPTTS